MFLAVKQALVKPEACTEQELKSIFYLHQISLYDSTPSAFFIAVKFVLL